MPSVHVQLQNLGESARCIHALKKRRRVLWKRGRVPKKRGRVLGRFLLSRRTEVGRFFKGGGWLPKKGRALKNAVNF